MPRKQILNETLVELGHKVHVDERRKKLDRKKRDKERDDWIEDLEYEEGDE